MMLVDGQDSGAERAVTPRRRAGRESTQPAGPSESGCPQARVRLAVAGSDGPQALATITGCTLCRRSVVVAVPGLAGANLEPPTKDWFLAAPRSWPRAGFACPYLAHPSNQDRLERVSHGAARRGC